MNSVFNQKNLKKAFLFLFSVLISFVLLCGQFNIRAFADESFSVEFVAGEKGSGESVLFNGVSGNYTLPTFSDIGFVPSDDYLQIGWTNDGQTLYNQNEVVSIEKNETFFPVFAKLQYQGVSFRKGDVKGVRFGFKILFSNINYLSESKLDGFYTIDINNPTDIPVASFACGNEKYYGAIFNCTFVNVNKGHVTLKISVALTVTINGIELNTSSLDVEGKKVTIQDKAQIALNLGHLTLAEAEYYGAGWTGWN